MKIQLRYRYLQLKNSLEDQDWLFERYQHSQAEYKYKSIVIVGAE